MASTSLWAATASPHGPGALYSRRGLGGCTAFSLQTQHTAPGNTSLSSELTYGDHVGQAHFSGRWDPRPSSNDAGTQDCAYRGQLIKLAEELIQQLHQLLGSALGRQAREAHNVRKEDAAREGELRPPPCTTHAAPGAALKQTSPLFLHPGWKPRLCPSHSTGWDKPDSSWSRREEMLQPSRAPADPYQGMGEHLHLHWTAPFPGWPHDSCS